ncbi:MAG: DUF433 domain-containing protein [Acidobacteriota bacterium]
MSKEYVEQVGEAYRVADTRVSLDSIVYGFWNGDSPESIMQSFPVLTLEQVYGAIAYYLDHQDEIDEYIKQGDTDYEAKREAARKADPMFYQKMAERRRQMTSV